MRVAMTIGVNPLSPPPLCALERRRVGTALADAAGAVMPSISTRIAADIARVIVRVRGLNVILDSELAALYGVETKALIRAVKRNRTRFPADFLLELTRQDATILRYQFGTSSWGGRRHLPYAFTEQGVAMLSSVLRSRRAITVNIEIMRAFVQLRRTLDSNSGLARKLLELESKYDGQFKVVFDAIRQLMAPPPRPGRRIGFRDSR